MKRIIGIILIVVLSLSSISFAEDNVFSDLPESHWAYDAVMTMTELGIISGYDDGTFRPNAPISRAEFATVMVKALGLEPKFDAQSSFVDMGDDHWVVPYVEAAKSYLTGFSSSAGLKFKPDEAAVREDMAVAILKAKGYEINESDVDYLEGYADQNEISSGLLKYVGSAIKHDIMVGSVENGNKHFNPVSQLTRAEAAVLLLKVVDNVEEKIVLNDSDVILAIEERIDELKLSWNVSIEDGLEGFKVVASKTDSSPIYPENGYVYYLNASQRAVELNGKLENHGGDSSYLEPGESYYFSITALYENGNIASNVIHMTYPGVECDDTSVYLEGIYNDGYIILEWEANDCDNISGYKVVASSTDETPIYPEDGYYKYISANENKRVMIPVNSYYNGGNIGKFEAGIEYHFAITALSGDEKIASNTVTLSFENEITETPTIQLFGESNGSDVYLEWTDENDSAITGFKVVASKNDGTPMYPTNGYYKYIPKGEGYSTTISIGDGYNNGDFSKFEAGENYYFSITALYGDQKVASNTLQFEFEASESVTPEVTLEGRVDGRYVLLDWTSYNDQSVDGFKVVASRSDSTPQYPDNGYYKYVRIGSEEQVLIEVGQHYNNGDFEYFEAGETYFFTITTLYSNQSVNSNTIKITFED